MHRDPAPDGTVGGIAVRGGAPGTREATIHGPTTPNESSHALNSQASSRTGPKGIASVASGVPISVPRSRANVMQAAMGVRVSVYMLCTVYQGTRPAPRITPNR